MVIKTVESEEAVVMPDAAVAAKKLTRKGKGKKVVAATEGADM